MAVVWYDSIEELIAGIKATPKEEALLKCVPEVTKILRKYIKSEIYGAYEPQPNAWVGGSTYKRRHVLEDNITAEFDGDNAIVVSSGAAPNKSIFGHETSSEDSGFLRLLESGNMGIWKSGFARPVISFAQKEVDGNARIQSILENAMKRVMNN